MRAMRLQKGNPAGIIRPFGVSSTQDVHGLPSLTAFALFLFLSFDRPTRLTGPGLPACSSSCTGWGSRCRGSEKTCATSSPWWTLPRRPGRKPCRCGCWSPGTRRYAKRFPARLLYKPFGCRSSRLPA